MTRFAFVDHVYEAAWAALPHNTMEQWFSEGCFGTSNFWELALKGAGHEAATFVLNNYPDMTAMLGSIFAYQPDVIASMEVGRFPSHMLRGTVPNAKIVAFCSHRADDVCFKGFSAIFSSFKWMPRHCTELGVNCEYIPLAFGRPVLDRIGPLPETRDIPVCFIGGLGSRIWDQGTKTMAAVAVAESVDGFGWWGYVAGSMSDLPVALQRAHQGQAWGIDAYRILARTKIALNRHGEIARGFGNNCRQYEATAMGCMLLTDDPGELIGHGIECGLEFCATYKTPDDAIDSIRHYLSPTGAVIGGASQGRSREYVLANHCYENRVPKFLSVIESL